MDDRAPEHCTTRVLLSVSAHQIQRLEYSFTGLRRDSGHCGGDIEIE